MIFMALPFVFVLFIIRFPAGLIVYWITTNLWTIGQQQRCARSWAPSHRANRMGRGRSSTRSLKQPKPPRSSRRTRGKGASKGDGEKPGRKAARGREPAGSGGRRRKSSGRSGSGTAAGRRREPGAAAAAQPREAIGEATLMGTMEPARPSTSCWSASRRPEARVPSRSGSRTTTTYGDVQGEDLGLFIGRHGQTIDAVQHLAQRIVLRRTRRERAGRGRRRGLPRPAPRRRSSGRPTRRPTRRCVERAGRARRR